MDRHWDGNPKVLVFYSQWGQTMKHYKVDNIANFVYYGKTPLTMSPLVLFCGRYTHVHLMDVFLWWWKLSGGKETMAFYGSS